MTIEEPALPERHAEPEEFRKALYGLDFPASRAAIHRKAQDKGGLDTEVLFILERLPDREYESLDDVLTELPDVYAAEGGLAGAGPAAPTAASREDKRVIEKMADPRAGEPN